MKQPTGEPVDPSARRRRAWKTTLYLAVLVAVVAVGWAAHSAVQSYVSSAGRTPRGLMVSPGPTTQPEWESSDPKRAAVSPYAAVGLEKLTGDPAGLPAPDGARRLFGFSRRRDDTVEQQAQYRFVGASDAAAEHYRNLLEQRGFKLLKDQARPGRRRVLVFFKGAEYATVALRSGRAKDILAIVVTAVGRAGGEKESKR